MNKLKIYLDTSVISYLDQQQDVILSYRGISNISLM